MKAHYKAVYKLHGANTLADGADSVKLLTLQTPVIEAILTTNPEPYFLHIDKSAAVGAQLLKSIFTRGATGTMEEKIVGELADVKAARAKATGKKGVFLVFEGEADIAISEFNARRDSDEFGVCLDDIDKPAIREIFRSSMQCVLAALGLSLPANADSRIGKIGDVVYLVVPDSEKPIYAFNLQGGSARASIASPLTEKAIAEAAKLASKLAGDKTMARPTSLLTTSLDEKTDVLQGFIAAWSALEIFVNAAFKAVYESELFKIMEEGAPASAKRVFKRFQDVMSDKYRLGDKFLVIASVLDAASAVDDSVEFDRLKKFRDGLLHALDNASSALPTEDVQKLLLKYMRLHFAMLP